MLVDGCESEHDILRYCLEGVHARELSALLVGLAQDYVGLHGPSPNVDRVGDSDGLSCKRDTEREEGSASLAVGEDCSAVRVPGGHPVAQRELCIVGKGFDGQRVLVSLFVEERIEDDEVLLSLNRRNLGCIYYVTVLPFCSLKYHIFHSFLFLRFFLIENVLTVVLILYLSTSIPSSRIASSSSLERV